MKSNIAHSVKALTLFHFRSSSRLFEERCRDFPSTLNRLQSRCFGTWASRHFDRDRSNSILMNEWPSCYCHTLSLSLSLSSEHVDHASSIEEWRRNDQTRVNLIEPTGDQFLNFFTRHELFLLPSLIESKKVCQRKVNLIHFLLSIWKSLVICVCVRVRVENDFNLFDTYLIEKRSNAMACHPFNKRNGQLSIWLAWVWRECEGGKERERG